MAKNKLTPEEEKAFNDYLISVGKLFPEQEERGEDEKYELIVFNDDIHSFDDIIINLMKGCKHTELQAIQCTNLIHYKGECQVKIGSLETLTSMAMALSESEIETTIKEI